MDRRISHEQYAHAVSSNVSKHVLDDVMNLSKQIHQTTKNVVLHREDCSNLDRKIQETLAHLQSTSSSNGTATKNIQNFEEILLTCLGLLDGCCSTDKSKQIFSDIHFKRTFDTLNKRLDDYKHNLPNRMVHHNHNASPNQHKETSSTPKPKHCFGQCQQPVFFFQPVSPCANGNCNKQAVCFLNGRRVPCNQMKKS